VFSIGAEHFDVLINANKSDLVKYINVKPSEAQEQLYLFTLTN
jgi:hypothetical protein